MTSCALPNSDVLDVAFFIWKYLRRDEVIFEVGETFYAQTVTFGLRIACDGRTMPIFAFSYGLRRATLRCSYDLHSLYDFVIISTFTIIFKDCTSLWPVDTSLVASYGHPAMIVRSPHDFYDNLGTVSRVKQN